jgi:DGQHR domain-containing protein
MIKTKAIRFTQNGRVFYSTVLPANNLIEMSKVDVWQENNGEKVTGYQRAPSRTRKREIAYYAIRDDAVMPIGGLANSRSKKDEGSYGDTLEFKVEYEIGNIAFGTLSITKESLPIYIVDMQHRLGGFEYAIKELEHAELKDYPLPITIADGLSLMEEVDQFDLINTTQKKVRTDLARRLKLIQSKDVDRRLRLDEKGSLWEAKGAAVASKLNKTEGVWKGKVMPPNASKKEYPNAVIKETSFVTSLKPILQGPYFSRLTEDHSAELIKRYWDAIAKLYPSAVKYSDKYVLLKTPGIFSLHMIAPEVFELARDKGTELSVEIIHDILSNIKEDFEEEFWESDSDEGAAVYGSMKGFKLLATRLKQSLPKLEVEL